MAPLTLNAIWRYFKLINSDSAQCNVCGQIKSRKGRTTPSLKNHLQSMHPEEYSLIISAKNEKESMKMKEDTGKIITPLQEAKKQLSSKETIQRARQWDKNNPTSKNIDKLIGEMIAMQDLPFNFVEGLGFRRLMQTIAPKYSLKERNFFTDYVCEDLYNKVAIKVKELVDDLDFMSFTTDIWTDPSSNVSLLSLTCHGVTKNFNRLSIILKCETFDDRPTGDIIANKFESMLAEWNISKNQVHCVICDEGLNMKRAMALSGFNDIDCTAHKLQLAIEAGLQSQQNIIDIKQKLKTITDHFNHSTIAQKQLKKIQERLNQPQLTVFQDCITRWNNTFYMFERFIKIKDALSLYFNDSKIIRILPEEWKIIERCVELLKPFEQATQELSNSQDLISSVIPTLHMLLKKLDEQLNKIDNTDPMLIVITTIKNEVAARLSALKNNFTFTLSTHLDPRYKYKFFESNLQEKIDAEVLKLVTGMSANINSSNPPKKLKITPSTEEVHEQQPSTSIACRSTLQSDLAMMLDSSSEDESLSTPYSNYDMMILKSQLKSYCSEKRIEVRESPLSWWNINSTKYECISALVRRFLSPPPASVPSEQPFSNAGLIYEPLRDRLKAEKASKLLFLKYNLPLLKCNY